MDINEVKFSIDRFEKMINENSLLFFDSFEFENIISYYLENGKIDYARKATNLSLSQHPSSTNLILLKVELYIYENKIMSQESLFTDDSQKISYVIKDDNTDQWTNNEKLANEFSKHTESIKNKIFFIQVNIGSEKTKSGILPEIADNFITYCRQDLKLNIAGLIERPNSGNVFINDNKVNWSSDKGISELRKKNIGFVFQFNNLLSDFSILENVAMPIIISGMKKNYALELLKKIFMQLAM